MKQRIVLSVLIERDKKYLFIRQNKKGGAYANTLFLPGGGLNPGEDIFEAIRREVKEETNLEIKNLIEYDFDSDVTVYKGKQIQFIFLRFLAKYKSGIDKAGDDAELMLWLNKSEIKQFDHNEPSIRFLKKLGYI